MYSCLAAVVLGAALAQASGGAIQSAPLPPVTVQEAPPAAENPPLPARPSYNWEEDITPRWAEEEVPAPRYEWPEEPSRDPTDEHVSEPKADADEERPPAAEQTPEPLFDSGRQEAAAAEPPPASSSPRRVAAFWMIVPGH